MHLQYISCFSEACSHVDAKLVLVIVSKLASVNSVRVLITALDNRQM